MQKQKQYVISQCFNSLTATGPYMSHFIFELRLRLITF